MVDFKGDTARAHSQLKEEASLSPFAPHSLLSFPLSDGTFLPGSGDLKSMTGPPEKRCVSSLAGI